MQEPVVSRNIKHANSSVNEERVRTQVSAMKS